MTRATLPLLSALLLGSSLLVAACTGSSDDDEDEAFVDEVKFRERFPAQVCSQIAQCCSTTGVPLDEASCHTQAAILLEDMAANGVNYDGAAAAECLRGYATPLAHCLVPTANDVRPCTVIYTGDVAPGGACQSSAECVDGSLCELDVDGNLVCVSYAGGEPGVEGEDCSDTCGGSPNNLEACVPVSADPNDKACYEADGLECGWETLTCVPLPGVGEPCEYYCAAGSYCDYATLLCEPLIPEGGTCGFNEECEGGSCVNATCGPEKIGAAACAEF
jgi:hypothetical protein